MGTLDTLVKFRIDMITLTTSKNRMCLFVAKRRGQIWKTLKIQVKLKSLIARGHIVIKCLSQTGQNY